MWRNLVLQLKNELNKHIMFSRVCEVASHVHGWWTSAFLGTSVWLHTPTPQIEAGSYCLHFEELRLRKMRWCVSVRQLPGSRLCCGVDSPAQCSFHQLERIPLCGRNTQGDAQCRDLEFQGCFWWLPLSLGEWTFSLWCPAFQNISIYLVNIFREPKWLRERTTVLTNMELVFFMCRVVVHMPFPG